MLLLKGCIVQLIFLHLKKEKFQTWSASTIFCKTHILFCKMQIMLMVLQWTMMNKARFDDEREMSVDDGLQGWTEDRNLWVHLMTWRRCRWGHQMTWSLKGWGPVVGLVLDVEGMKVRSSCGALMLKHRRTELVMGYLAPRNSFVRNFSSTQNGFIFGDSHKIPFRCLLARHIPRRKTWVAIFRHWVRGDCQNIGARNV